MNHSQYDASDPESLQSVFERMVETHPKFRYKLKCIMGDYYYEEMSIEEAKSKIFLKPERDDKVLTCQQDIDDYVRDNMNKRMPLDGPMVRVFIQKYDPVDENKDRPEADKVQTVMVWKCLHAFCDGVSVTSMTLAHSEEYDRSYFVRSVDSTFLQRFMLRAMVPFQIPNLVFQSFFAAADQNSLMKNKERMSGNINISSSPAIDLEALKATSKKMNVTVNDIILCALTTALHSYFLEKNEKVERVKVLIPANIRFFFYPTAKDVKLENKFCAIPLTIPITQSMEKAYGQIKQASAALKSSFGLVYCYYAISFWLNQVCPRAFILGQLTEISRKFTLAFSNTPGAVKMFKYKDNKGKVFRNLLSQSYVMVAGKVGIALCAISQSGGLRLSLNSDDNILGESDNRKLLTLMYDNICSEISKHKGD